MRMMSSFPLKDMYDRVHGTLEGRTAPYGSVGDVAPQGIADLGCPPDTGPVGSAIGDGAEALQDDDPASGDAAGDPIGPALEPVMDDPACVPDHPLGAPPTDNSNDGWGDQR